MDNDIVGLCNGLNNLIHDRLYHNFYNIPNELKYNQTFTSIDLIEDSQMAIEEFENVKSNGKRGRSTLLIYGLFQSLFLQQDGLYHLYKCVVDQKAKLDDFFGKFFFDKDIREVRNDIAGHPTNRNNKEFYFIAKGQISKDRFAYAGYTPTFRSVEVDVKLFLSKQYEFARKVLLIVQDDILKKIEMKKDEHKNKSLQEMTIGLSRNIELIYRGISDKERNFQGEWGISGVKNSISEVSKELKLRFNGNLPGGVSDTFRMIEYIIHRFNEWWTERTLLGNNDAEIFLDSLTKQLNGLEEMMKEIDKEFNN